MDLVLSSKPTGRSMLRADGQQYRLIAAPYRRGTAWTSGRFAVDTASGAELEPYLPSALGLDRLQVELRRWRGPQPAGP